MDASCRNSSYFDQTLFDQWSNLSSFNSNVHLELYICAYKELASYKELMIVCFSYAAFFCSFSGILSSILTLVTLSSNCNFKSVSFLYYKAIAYLEFLHMVFLIHMGLQYIFHEESLRSYTWVWLSIYVFEPGINLVSSCVDVSTAMLSIERAVACLWPTKFQLLNTRRIAWTVITATSVIFFPLMVLPPCLGFLITKDPTSNTYTIAMSKIGESKAYDTFNYTLDVLFICMGAGVVGTTVLAIVGLLKYEYKK